MYFAMSILESGIYHFSSLSKDVLCYIIILLITMFPSVLLLLLLLLLSISAPGLFDKSSSDFTDMATDLHIDTAQTSFVIRKITFVLCILFS